MKQGWEYKKLGEVCEIYQPKTISSDKLIENGRYKVYGANGTIGFYNEYNHIEKEILLTCRGATCGTINVSEPYSWINGNAMVIHRKDKTVDFSFLKYHMKSIDYSLIITGAAQPQITRQMLSPVLIALPPLSVQQSLVTELDKINEVIDLKKAQLKELDLLAQSIFYEMFGDPIENPKGWEVKKLGDVCKVGTGSTPNRKRTDYYEGLIPWVKSTEVANCRIDKTEEHISDIAIKETNCSLYPKGTLLMAMYGQGRTRGQIAILDIDATTNQAVAAILPNEYLSIDYLYQYLHLQYDNIRSMARGGNQANLNLSLVKSILFPLPPLSLQQSFAEKIQAIESQKSAIKQSLAEVETLLASRMDYYFN